METDYCSQNFDMKIFFDQKASKRSKISPEVEKERKACMVPQPSDIPKVIQ